MNWCSIAEHLRLRLQRSPQDASLSVLVKPVHLSSHQVDFRMFLQVMHLLFQPIRTGKIVPVHPGNQFSCRMVQTLIQRMG